MFSIRWKLVTAIILPLLLMSGVVMGLTLQRLYRSAADTLLEQHMREVELLARSIDFELQSMARIAMDTAAFLEIDPQFNDEELYSLLQAIAGSSDMIHGAGIAFEPYSYDAERRLFAPYVFDADLKRIDLSTLAGDYTEANTPWYSDIRASGSSGWTEPYYDTGAGTMPITTFATPISRNREFFGVTTLDLRLDRLGASIARLLDDRSFMVLSPGGRFVLHDDPATPPGASINDSIQEQSNTEYEALAGRLAKGERGFAAVAGYRQNGEVIEGNTWFFHTPIPSTGWALITLVEEDVLMAPLIRQMGIAIVGLSLTVVLIFGLVWFVSSRLARPIKKLEAAVSEVARGRLDTEISNIRSMDELGRLSIGFNRMLRNLRKQIELQSQQTTARKIVERELQMARETQRSLLPTEFPPFPEQRDFDLHAVSQPAHHVAGDFFDFFLVNPRTLFFVIADVSGKGMSAALVMAVTRTIVRDLARGGSSPADILQETNERLRESQKGSAFVTIFLGSYNIPSGKVSYANGGHPPPFLLARNGQISTVGEATGTIVGMLEGQVYRNAELRLAPGETLLLYTDGFTEARSPEGEFYGPGRLKALLQASHESSTRELCETAVRDITQFQNSQLADDLTILALRRNISGLSGLFRSA